jgi:RNA polymerase sigma factor (sigma-70 family)
MGGMHWNNVYALVQGSKAGDDRAWRQLHDLVDGYLHGQAQRLIGPAWPFQSIHDLIQETWQRAFQGLQTFRGGEDDEQTSATLRAWLSKIMRRTYLDMIRRQGPNPPVPVSACAPSGVNGSHGVMAAAEPPAPDPTPSHGVRFEEQQTQIERALEQLADPVDRRVVDLVFYQDRSLRQAAGELGLTYDQVRYRLDKVLARLGDRLKALQ